MRVYACARTRDNVRGERRAEGGGKLLEEKSDTLQDNSKKKNILQKIHFFAEKRFTKKSQSSSICKLSESSGKTQ